MGFAFIHYQAMWAYTLPGKHVQSSWQPSWQPSWHPSWQRLMHTLDNPVLLSLYVMPILNASMLISVLGFVLGSTLTGQQIHT